jgi:pyruvate kinase
MLTPSQPGVLLTKILATLGPASEDEATIERLIEAGVRAFRINFSHGDFADYERMLKGVRAASERLSIPVAVIGDLSGPKIRVGEVIDGGIELLEGEQVVFQKPPIVAGATGDATAGGAVLSSTYPSFVDEVEPGEVLLLDDGSVRLVCREKSGSGSDKRLICDILEGGLVTSHKGINLPETHLTLPALTDRDLACMEFAVERSFDYLALSFVRCANDVRELKSRLRDLGCSMPEDIEDGAGGSLGVRRQAMVGFDESTRRYLPVISKIEKPQALADIEAIVEESHGIMVARGDLGVEMDLAEVPVVQRRIIELCHQKGRLVIVATQMLQSMIESPSPTRAEVSDVANAIFDGADVVMLSGETAVGRWPVRSARMMSRIADRSNAYLQTQPITTSHARGLRESSSQTEALAHGVATIVGDLDAKLVIMWARADGSPRFMSQNRLRRPVIVFSDNPQALRALSLYYGLTPTYMDQPEGTAEFITAIDGSLRQRGWAEVGDLVVVVVGEPLGEADYTNSIRIHAVRES